MGALGINEATHWVQAIVSFRESSVEVMNKENMHRFLEFKGMTQDQVVEWYSDMTNWVSQAQNSTTTWSLPLKLICHNDNKPFNQKYV